MTVFINPGSGPVPDATEQHASMALDVFLIDLGEGYFPRLYVDGSSWIWQFALNLLHGCDEDGGERE